MLGSDWSECVVVLVFFFVVGLFSSTQHIEDILNIMSHETMPSMLYLYCQSNCCTRMKLVIWRILSEALAVPSGNTAVGGKYLRRCGNSSVFIRDLSLSCKLCGKTQGNSKKKELTEKKLVCRAHVCHVVGRNKNIWGFFFFFSQNIYCDLQKLNIFSSQRQINDVLPLW